MDNNIKNDVNKYEVNVLKPSTKSKLQGLNRGHRFCSSHFFLENNYSLFE